MAAAERRITRSARGADVDLDAQTLTIAKAIIVDGWTPVESDPKTEESAGTIGLDSLNVAVLREHRGRQREEKAKLGAGWVETGKVFTQQTAVAYLK